MIEPIHIFLIIVLMFAPAILFFGLFIDEKIRHDRLKRKHKLLRSSMYGYRVNHQIHSVTSNHENNTSAVEMSLRIDKGPRLGYFEYPSQ